MKVLLLFPFGKPELDLFNDRVGSAQTNTRYDSVANTAFVQ